MAVLFFFLFFFCHHGSIIIHFAHSNLTQVASHGFISVTERQQISLIDSRNVQPRWTRTGTETDRHTHTHTHKRTTHTHPREIHTHAHAGTHAYTRRITLSKRISMTDVKLQYYLQLNQTKSTSACE